MITQENVNKVKVLEELFWLVEECDLRCLEECSRWYI